LKGIKILPLKIVLFVLITLSIINDSLHAFSIGNRDVLKTTSHELIKKRTIVINFDNRNPKDIDEVEYIIGTTDEDKIKDLAHKVSLRYDKSIKNYNVKDINMEIHGITYIKDEDIDLIGKFMECLDGYGFPKDIMVSAIFD
jgi:hypothetical protein